MASTSKISVMITASVAGLKTGMSQASSAVMGFKSKLGMLTGGLLSFQGLLGGLTIGAVTRFVQVQFKALDVLGDTTKKLGIQTKEFQSLARAAKLNGMDQEGFATSLKFLSNTAVEAANGSKELQASYERLGIDVKKFVDLPLEQKFEMLAIKMQGIRNESERVKLAMDLLGRAGIESLNTLNEVASKGREGLKREAEALDILKSDAEIAKAQKAVDAVDDMTMAMRGLGQELAIQSSGAVQKAAGVFTLLIERLGSSESIFTLIRKHAKAFKANQERSRVPAGMLPMSLNFPQPETSPYEKLVNLTKNFSLNLQSAQKSWEEIMRSGEKVEKVDSIFDRTEKLIAQARIQAGLKSWASFNIESNLSKPNLMGNMKLAAINKRAEEKRRSEEKGLFFDDSGMVEPSMSMQDVQVQLMRQKMYETMHKDALEEGMNVFEKTRTPLEKYNEEMTRLGKLLQWNAINQDTFNRAVKEAQEELANATIKQDEFEASADKFNRAFQPQRSPGSAVQAESLAHAGVGAGVRGAKTGGVQIQSPQLEAIRQVLTNILGAVDYGIPARAM